MTLTAQERALHWRTLDAAHAGYELDGGSPASLNGTFPRAHDLVCCGWRWENRADLEAHRDCVHR